MKYKDLSGMKYGRLTVIGRADNKSNRIAWLCECECGNKPIVLGQNLKSGHTKSCGCYFMENLSTFGFKHGHSPAKGRSLENSSWNSMIQRCTNKNSKAYSSYGERGITVCDRWMKFENFLEDMGIRPDGEYSLDRIDNNDGYYPENCRWATRKTQQRNMSSNNRIEFDGLRLTLMEWSEKTGLTMDAIRNRIRSGWRIDHVLSIPSGKAGSARKALLVAEGENNA